VRPILEGTIFKIVDFRIMPDFGLGTTVLQDAYVDVRLAPALEVRAGKFKEPVGLERLRSATAMTFSLRGLPTTIVPNRDLGVEIFGDFASHRVEYAIGVFNGVPIAGTRGKQEGSLGSPGLASYKTTATIFGYRSDGTVAGTTIGSGSRRRLSPQASYFRGPFGLLAEYAESATGVRRAAAKATLRNSASQIAASWVFGGENTFAGVNVKREFTGPGTGPGAFEIAARVHEARFDRDSFPLYANPASAAERARAWGLGLNWWANRGLRTLLSYEEIHFTGGAANGGDRPTEKVLFTRVQVSF
jgi:phosphate-selective porin OprO/OprP